ncbi:S-adenosyl methyltransferase [Actinopolyspora lacussalsi subsp. righensis]|uniref:S-adenosyl methyltransferase n=1 Tax=Actinopolyspora righensis TaxID=995060 RepID=A0A1I6X9V9_9ACTN|nr:SAM-dependent methyltransferase [Actinopolyspora righensis]SFT35158.1 S-adenosyl methyltransferase [Actinopolyspora righensis]
METGTGEQPPQVDEQTPNIARMYDYFLGGSAHFESDRAAAEEFLRVYPGNTLWAQHNRSFLGRAVRELCELGIDQFLDLGSGIPTVGNVHEIAHRTNPDARVAYVDIEPVAVSHAEHMLRGTELATITRADMRRPEQVLNAPGVAGLLDFTRPVAVLAVAILDIISVRDPHGMLATYREACAPGSALAVTNGAQLTMTDEERAGIDRVMSGTTTPHVTFRDPEEVRELFAGYTLLEPGVVPSAAWRPAEPVTDEAARHSNGYAAVGIRSS